MPDQTPETPSDQVAPASPAPSLAAPGGTTGGDLAATLEEAVAALDAVPGADPTVAGEAATLREVIAGHLLPRSRGMEPPLLVAVTGLGGVGKSRLVNLLVDAPVTSEGPLRPTTTAPTLIVATTDPLPAHLDGLLAVDPELRIVTRDDASTGGLALLDLPAWADQPGDRDASRMLDRMVEIADLVIVVTTPARYADAAMWSLLDALAGRGLETWTVLNQADSADDEIAGELRRLLAAAGHEPSVTVIERGGDGGELRVGLSHQTMDPAAADARLRSRLGSVRRRLLALADAVDEIGRADARLLAIVDEQHRAAAADLSRVIDRGGLSVSTGAPWADTMPELAGVITHRIGDVASRTTAAWLDDPRGVALVAAGGDALWRHPPEAAATAVAHLQEWPDAVGRLVDADGRRRLRPKVREALVAAAMSRALGGTTAVKRRWARKLRSGIDEVASRARLVLSDTSVGLVSADRDRFVARLGGRPDPELGNRLRTAADAMGDTRPAGDGADVGRDGTTEPDDA